MAAHQLDLLAVQDAGEALTPPERALLLASLAPGNPPVAGEPVGRTNARLLRLYEQLAGPLVEGTVACAGCGATVEFAVSTAQLLATEPDIDTAPPPLTVGAASVRWRPVSYDDLVAAAAAVDAEHAVAEVLARCLEAADDIREAAALRPKVSTAMATADPLAELDLDLACPECGAAVRAELDVLGFTWAQVRTQAENLLVEVDALARVYSWSEAEILALPPARRRRFVELATGGL